MRHPYASTRGAPPLRPVRPPPETPETPRVPLNTVIAELVSFALLLGVLAFAVLRHLIGV
ncbi:hypothetical protein AB0E21_06910 [Streptomyces sp. NPDC047967]|uniref:hypothetical protein n=1 Tax=Streptomyces sp. NPDC047967 TaxID=3154924 RepID=UPI0034077BA0